MIPPHTCTFLLLLLLILPTAPEATSESVTKQAEELSSSLHSIFESATKSNDITKAYSNLADAEVFDARAELKAVKRKIELYLKERAKMAWDAKVSLESRDILMNVSEDGEPRNVNDPQSKDFIRYYNAKRQTDAQIIYLDGHFGGTVEVNATREYELRRNPNFYGTPTTSETSAVHVPTPVYNRNPSLLERIEWSNIDQLFRRNRERVKDLSFQKFCSQSGFMRYFPAAPWIFDNREMELDLFDCRNTEWFIDAATMSKNVILLLDLSGSMLGQRLEIGLKTIETVLDTLSDKDFLNILAFSKSADFMSECAHQGLVQATARNKKLLLSRLANVTSEGKADYEKALVRAFTTLMDLPGTIYWRTKDELARERAEGTLDSDMTYLPIEDNILVVPDSYLESIKKFTGNQQRMGCSDLIMLITDGAPNTFNELFALYNSDKRIRFFSFLVGEEAKDFDQVRWMACHNRGFMVHITNLADIQEKVQTYVRVMSRPVSLQSASIHQENAIWSGTGRERMSSEFVISVSYPVVLDGAFMGVSAVSIPLVELAQIGHPSLVGGRSYFFMLDTNGYAMFHPQLRPLDPLTGEIKPTYNNMDFAEIDIQQHLSGDGGKTPILDCQNEPKGLQTLFGVERLRRVYRQRNNYFAECIEGTHFVAALSIAEGDHARIKRSGAFTPKGVDLSWMDENNWRLNPKWRYCLLNDSDLELGAEGGFKAYARQMRDSGDLPEMCRARRKLVDRLLLDLQATSTLSTLWDLDWKKNKKHGVHLSFFSTPTGLIRYMNESLEDLFYEHPEGLAETNPDLTYKHFLLDLNPESTDSDYFRRAVRQRGRIVFDINRQTRMWTSNNDTTAYGHSENETLLALAYKALYVNEALVGVAGIEFLYDKLALLMKKLGCHTNDDSTRCFLLDEHAYVVYTSQGDILYSDYIKANMPDMGHLPNQSTPAGKRRRPTHHRHHHQMLPQQLPKTTTGTQQRTPTVPLGSFFGHINRITEWTMELLIKKGFYTAETFIDSQAMCEQELPIVSTFTATAAATIIKPFNDVINAAVWSLARIGVILYHLSLLPFQFTHSMQSYGVQTNPMAGKEELRRYPCRMESKFYLASHLSLSPDDDQGKRPSSSAALLEENYSERPCKHNAAQCAAKVYASWVESTNLLLVVVKQGSRSKCYEEAHCAMSLPPTVPFGFHKIEPPVESAGGTAEEVVEVRELEDEEELEAKGGDDSGDGTGVRRKAIQYDTSSCISSLPKGRKSGGQCLRDDYLEDEMELPCSGAMATGQWRVPTLLLVLLSLSAILTTAPPLLRA